MVERDDSNSQDKQKKEKNLITVLIISYNNLQNSCNFCCVYFEETASDRFSVMFCCGDDVADDTDDDGDVSEF